jgi:hypothetical protein
MSAALQGYITARHPYARAADEVELAWYSRHAQQLQNGGVDLHQQQQQQQPEQPAREQADPQPQQKEEVQQQQLTDNAVLAAGQQQITRTVSKVGDGSDNVDVVAGGLQDQPGDIVGGKKTEL